MLNINKQAENGKLVIALEGRLDTTTSPVLEVELKSSLDGVTIVIKVCSNIIDSSISHLIIGGS